MSQELTYVNSLYIQPNALYYLKLKNYLHYIALIQYKLSLVFKIYLTCFGASLAPSSGVSLKPDLLAWLAFCWLQLQPTEGQPIEQYIRFKKNT
jgi:hypothetical protein